MKKEGCSFLKKRTKKLLDLGADSPASVHAKDQKSFASFLQKRRPFFYLTAASLITLTSCASPNPDFYTLQPVSGAVIAAPAQSIELRRPGLAGYLDRSDVVLKSADYHINVNSQSRWAEPMGDMIGRVLAEDLSQRLPASSVFNESGAITADPSLRVEIDVQRFDLGADGQVTLTAETALESGRGHLPLKTHHIMLQAAPVGPGPANLAATMSSLLGQLADRVAQDVGAISP